jgi:hypothetical protein
VQHVEPLHAESTRQHCCLACKNIEKQDHGHPDSASKQAWGHSQPCGFRTRCGTSLSLLNDRRTRLHETAAGRPGCHPRG